MPHVTGAAPGMLGKALIQTAGATMQFITIKGIDPALEPRSPRSRGRCSRAASTALTAAPDSEQPDGILLGQDLARTLGTFVGDSVTVLTPEATLIAVRR